MEKKYCMLQYNSYVREFEVEPKTASSVVLYFHVQAVTIESQIHNGTATYTYLNQIRLTFLLKETSTSKSSQNTYRIMINLQNKKLFRCTTSSTNYTFTE
jgi:hypothetical protein